MNSSIVSGGVFFHLAIKAAINTWWCDKGGEDVVYQT